MTTAAAMIGRFAGDAGKAKLIEVLTQQRIVGGDRVLAERIATVGRLVSFEPDETVCKQEGIDDDTFFLVNGDVNVFVNHQQIATRKAGEVVGEMAAIDSGARRSATLKAATPVVALRLSAEEFTKAGNDSATFWRYIAQIAAERLRERAKFHLPANEIPIMFVGSSVEGLDVAHEIYKGLQHDEIAVRVWTHDVFGPSKFSIEDLMQQVEHADFALFVFGPDDKIESRDKVHAAPRDNVVFEMGLFMGRLGRERVFIVMEHGADLKIPTDLLGINPIKYKCKPHCAISDFIGPVCLDLRKAIASKGALTSRMKVSS